MLSQSSKVVFKIFVSFFLFLIQIYSEAECKIVYNSEILVEFMSHILRADDLVFWPCMFQYYQMLSQVWLLLFDIFLNIKMQ